MIATGFPVTHEPFVPRPHQTECVRVLVAYENRFSVGEVTVAGGKSDILGMLALHYSQYGRVIVVAHNKELVEIGRAHV